MKKALQTIVAFAAGLAVGVWWVRSPADAGGRGEDVASTNHGIDAKTSLRPDKGDPVSLKSEEGTAPAEEEVAAPAPTVEVLVDNSPAPEPEILAAHAARCAKRQAAREAKEKERREFLSTLNLDLLTDEQRKAHELYIKANATRAAVRKEISALRAAGKEVPADLQARLSEAETVLRVDRDAERHALREAAARAAGLEESAVRQLMEDLMSIERTLGAGH